MTLFSIMSLLLAWPPPGEVVPDFLSMKDIHYVALWKSPLAKLLPGLAVGANEHAEDLLAGPHFHGLDDGWGRQVG